MANAFGIFGDSVDRAAIGWPVDMAYGDNNDIWSETLWDGMTINGKTLDQAIQDATYNTTNHLGCYTAYRVSQLASPVRVGDPTMKVHGVYGGSGLQWHLP